MRICKQYIWRIMKKNIRLYSILNWIVDVSVCRSFWFVHVLVYRLLGMSRFWLVDVLVCRRFGLPTFRFVNVSVCRRFGCRRFGLSMFWPVTYKRVYFNTSKPGYKTGHHFADDISKWISSMTFLFHNFAIQEFYFLNLISWYFSNIQIL